MPNENFDLDELEPMLPMHVVRDLLAAPRKKSQPSPFRGHAGVPWCNEDEDHPIYHCFIEIHWNDVNGTLGKRVIAETIGYTPAQAAAKATVTATCLAAYLNSYCTRGRLTFDAHFFAELFELPTNINVPE